VKPLLNDADLDRIQGDVEADRGAGYAYTQTVRLMDVQNLLDEVRASRTAARSILTHVEGDGEALVLGQAPRA